MYEPKGAKCKKGENNGNAKLTKKNVEYIREIHISNAANRDYKTTKELAFEFGVHRSTIDKIIEGIRHKEGK